MPRLAPLALMLFVTGAFLRPGNARAQTTIRGRVTDAETGEPLPEANIFIEGARRGTITNREGRYTLRIEQALPATVVFRYVGYRTRRLGIDEGAPAEQDVRLEPATSEREDVTVTAERGSAADIMRRVIAAKQERRKRLKTYRADAYNRLVIRNDTGIVSVVEALTKFYWDREKGPREVAISQRQTANLGIEGALPAGLFVTNLYDDDIDVAGYEMVGVTSPKALDVYRFRLDSVRVLDGRGVYDISVEPRSRFASAFTGRVAVLDGAFALLEAELRPARSFLFPPPIRSLRVTYRQRYSDFGKDFWLPVSFHSTVEANIALPALISLPPVRVEQVSRLSDYKVNAPLPDSLYDEKDEDVLRSAAGKEAPGDSLIKAEAAATVPLEAPEARAVATIDSTQTLEKAFKPRGLLADLADFSAGVNDDEVANTAAEDDTTDALLSTDFALKQWYNRVEGGHLGARAALGIGEGVELYGTGGYQTARKAATYGGGIEVALPGDLALRAGYRYGVDPRYESQVYDLFGGGGRGINSLQMLFGATDYFDYYGNERVRLMLARALPLPVESRLTVGVRAERHFSVEKNTAYDLLGEDDDLPPNPAISADGAGPDDGADEDLRSAVAELTLGGSSPVAALGITGQRRLALRAEYSPGSFPGNDFDFARFSATADYHVETFLRRRFLPMTLDLRLTGSTFTGTLPIERFSIVEAQMSVLSGFGVLKTLDGRPYEGEQALALFWEHNFRTAPFEALGLYGLAERGWSVLLYGGHGRTWIGEGRRDALADSGVSLNTPTGGFHHEIGVGLSGLLGLFRVNVTKRLDAGGWAAGVGLARIF